MGLDDIIRQIRAFRDERDWQQFHGHKEMAISVAVEASELLEHFQWKTAEEVKTYAKEHKSEIAEEIADVAIYLLELADNMNIDIAKAITEKLKKNAIKYPVEKAKGVHTKYTKL